MIPADHYKKQGQRGYIMYCCWDGTIRDFLLEAKDVWRKTMQDNHEALLAERAGAAQLRAWDDCYDVLHEHLPSLRPSYKNGHIIFEYVLPREGGRRPDVVLLIGDAVLVLEFKQKFKYSEADLDQAAGYARDLREYHLESRNSKVTAYLVATKRLQGSQHVSGIRSLAPMELAATINALPIADRNVDRGMWIASDYVPLPGLIQAAIDIFENQDLPHIRRAHSYGIPQAIAEMESIIDSAKRQREHHIIFVTGVPGAGKTLLGLQAVYTMNKKSEPAVFLSGNGPLVKVLSHALSTNALIKGLHTFTNTYADHSNAIPCEHIVIFDEAQRAWDAGYKKNKHRGSEPEQLIRICNRHGDWGVLIALIGEGQEIHLGEEAGIAQWNSALIESPIRWHCHIPEKLSSVISAADTTNPLFNLDQTLRSHLASDVIQWIEFLLSGRFDHAASLYEKIRAEGFAMYLTGNIEKAKQYCIAAYGNAPNKRYGLIASSKDQDLPSYGIPNGYEATKNVDVARWYNDKPESALSCCQLNTVETEFGCQGLELDMPIVCWGDDLLWRGDHWQTRAVSTARDPHQLRLNSYRVLLSRGRDGFIIFLPPSPQYNATRKALKASGLKPLVMPHD